MAEVETIAEEEKKNKDELEYDSAFAEFSGEAKDPLSDVDVKPDLEQAAKTGEEVNNIDPDKDPKAESLNVEQLQEQLKIARNAASADSGRVSAFQRKLNAQIEEIAALKSAATKPDEVNPSNSGMSNEDWNKFQEEFPEIAEGIVIREKAVSQSIGSQIDTKIGEINKKVDPLVQKTHDDYAANQNTILSDKHPGWKETVSSETFGKWLSEQPATVRGLVNSDDAQDASYLLDSFKLTQVAVVNTKEIAKEVHKESSQKRLESAIGIKSTSRGKSTGIPEEYGDAWDHFSGENN